MKAPFTDEQVKNINEYQVAGFFHPFTCTTGSHVLVAETDGLHCPLCPTFHQDWVHDGMADGSIVAQGNSFRGKLKK